MRKSVFIAVAVLLLLTGCMSNAPMFTEALLKGFDTLSYESKSTLTIDTNLPAQDDATKRVLQTLKSGIAIREQQKDLQNAHAEVSFVDPNPLMETGLWPGKDKPAADIYVQGGDVYVKTTADNKYLGIKDVTSGQNDAESAEQLKSFLIEMVKNNPYTLQNITVLGDEPVALPDGSTETASHVRITADFKEMIDMVTAVLDSLSKSPEADGKLSGIFGSLPSEDPAAGSSINDDLADMVKELKALNVEQLKAEGWDVHLTLDAWVNADHLFNQIDAAVTVQAPASVISDSGLDLHGMKSVWLTIKLHRQIWNQNKAVSYSVPAADQIITTEQLEKDPGLAAEFGEGSPLAQLAAFLAAPQEEPFSDVPEDHWAYGPIMALRSSGIVSGYETNEFKPDRPITRSEFITMTAKSLGLEPSAKKLAFKDRAQIPAWSEEYWQAAVNSGIIKGYADGTLKPNEQITRAEMTAILVRGMGQPLQSGYKLTYKDAKAIPAWAAPYVKTATAKGLIHGTPDNQFAPQRHASRAEVATVLFNAMFGGE